MLRQYSERALVAFTRPRLHAKRQLLCPPGRRPRPPCLSTTDTTRAFCCPCPVPVTTIYCHSRSAAISATAAAAVPYTYPLRPPPPRRRRPTAPRARRPLPPHPPPPPPLRSFAPARARAPAPAAVLQQPPQWRAPSASDSCGGLALSSRSHARAECAAARRWGGPQRRHATGAADAGGGRENSRDFDGGKAHVERDYLKPDISPFVGHSVAEIICNGERCDTPRPRTHAPQQWSHPLRLAQIRTCDWSKCPYHRQIGRASCMEKK